MSSTYGWSDIKPTQEVQILANPEQVSGDPELPGFRLLMAKIW
ncbi:MAG: hypothetical protein RLO19_17200 [Coleofasciculus sp. G2-EDA-02]